MNARGRVRLLILLHEKFQKAKFVFALNWSKTSIFSFSLKPTCKQKAVQKQKLCIFCQNDSNKYKAIALLKANQLQTKEVGDSSHPQVLSNSSLPD